VLKSCLGRTVPQMCLHLLDAGDLGHVGQAGAAEYLVVEAIHPGFFPRLIIRTRFRKLFVWMAVPRAEGNMKNSGLASDAACRHHSSSVSSNAGSQTSLPSVLVSTSMP
jgi:hypothetical protein